MWREEEEEEEAGSVVVWARRWGREGGWGESFVEMPPLFLVEEVLVIERRLRARGLGRRVGEKREPGKI